MQTGFTARPGSFYWLALKTSVVAMLVSSAGGTLLLFGGLGGLLAGRKPGDIDFFVVRENTEVEYSSIGGRMFPGTDREVVLQESVMSRTGVDRILKFAFDLAQSRPSHYRPWRDTLRIVDLVAWSLLRRGMYPLGLLRSLRLLPLPAPGGEVMMKQ